jgi:NADPH-dependent curcumin reductase CurA
MRRHGRIVISGQISEYNAAENPRGIRNTLPFITQRLKMEGLVVYDFNLQFNEARAQMAEWVRSGRLTYREEIIDGIEQAPAAFIGLFSGDSFGRRLVHVGD